VPDEPDRPLLAPSLMPLTTEYARIHPEDWRQLDRRFEDVKTYVDTRAKAVEDRTEKLEEKLDGNGQPGLATRLTRVETKVKVVLSAVGGALVIVGGYLLTFLPQAPKQP
jgi:hypothetical protein